MSHMRNTVNVHCQQVFPIVRYINDSEDTETAENADVIFKGKPQLKENGIIGYVFAVSNFCMWDKWLNHSAVKL